MNDEELMLLNRLLLASQVVSNNSKVNPENYVREEDQDTNNIKPIPLPTVTNNEIYNDIKR